MSVLSTMMAMNSMFDHAPTSASATAISRLNRLKSVHTLSLNICPVVLVARSGGVFCRPLSRRRRTSSPSSPIKASGVQRISI